MRRFDKKKQMVKANILAEQRYLNEKGMVDNIKGKIELKKVTKLKHQIMNAMENYWEFTEKVNPNPKYIKDLEIRKDAQTLKQKPLCAELGITIHQADTRWGGRL